MKTKEKIKFPTWMKLDNAATIYPPTLTKRYASMFRMTLTLTEKIDKDLLEKAMSNVIIRFPSFRYKLKQGLFWYYFKYNKETPGIQEDYKNPLLRINFKKNKGFMFRIRYFDKRLSIEYFHALTDGTGGITFLLTLAGEYLRIKHKLKITYNDKVLNPKDEPIKDEYSDSFPKFSRKIGKLEHEKPAYHYKGTKEEKHILNIVTGIISVKNLKEKTKEYNCTITQFLASIMVLSIQEIQNRERSKKQRKKEIKVSIPINLRKLYDTKTLRNFSSYANIGIDPKYGMYTLEEIIKIMKNKMELSFTEKMINSKITANVKLSRNYFIRLIPMFIKKHILSAAEFFMGDRYNSTTFSNLGQIELPKEIEKYVKDLGFMIGRSRSKPGSCGCVSYKDELYITFTRKIKESEFERLFFTKLVEMGIPVTIESNRGR